tara:strand:- start:37 stop:318 length:282 start_codon:yes stop_codon:yes gene_type:complete
MAKYTKAAAVTAHDSTDQSIDTINGTAIDAIYIGGAGNVHMQLSGDSSAVLFKNMLAGTIYPLSAKLIKASASTANETTATDIVALDTGKRYV